MARPSWIETTVHVSEPAEVYLDPEGNIKMTWPIPELQGSRVTVGITVGEARKLASDLNGAADDALLREQD